MAKRSPLATKRLYQIFFSFCITKKQYLFDDDVKADKYKQYVEFCNDKPITVTLPDTVTLEVVSSDAVVKNQTASSSYKPATLENGVRVMVPPFVETGDKIIVRTDDATYVERAKK